MTVTRCPACDAANRIAQAAVWRFKRLRCDACGVLMEIIDEHPCTAEWVLENWPYPEWMLHDWPYEEVAGAASFRRTLNTEERRLATHHRTKTKNAAKGRRNV